MKEPRAASARSEHKSTKPEVSPEIKAFRAGYEKVFPKTFKDYKAATGKFGEVAGRVKSEESIAQKMSGRYAGKPLSDLSDAVGMRTTVKSVDDIYAALAVVKRKFKVLSIDNKLEQGQGYYRALHVEFDSMGEGKKGEIQIRTVRQSNIASWGHDVAYKGPFKDNKEVQDYAKAVSDAAWEEDNGRKGTYPEPPKVLLEHGLEFNTERAYYDDWLFKERGGRI